MAGFAELRRRLSVLLRGRRFDRDLEDEIRLHQALRAERDVAQGATPAEAAVEARRAFGGALRVREESRLAWGWQWLEDALQDAQHGLRLLARTPGFTLTAMLTLALGLGATTAIWTVVHGVLLRRAPVGDLPRLVVVWETDRNSGTSREPASVPDYLDFEAHARTLDGLAALNAGETAATLPGHDPEMLAVLRVTTGLPSLLGLRPIAGRTFAPDDAGAPVALISESLWRRAFAGSPAVLGERLNLATAPATIVGVMPDGADFGVLQMLGAAAYGSGFADRGEATRVDAWLPLDLDTNALPRSTHPILLVGRLAPGSGLPQVQEELAAVAADLEARYPENRGRGVHVEALADVVFGPVRAPLYMLLSAVALLLVVSSVNVAGLLLARGAARSEELAARRALGAGRSRLIRQFVVESLLLTAGAGLLGVALAWIAVRGFVAIAPASVPRATQVSIDGMVLAATAAVLGLVALTFSVVPAVQSGGESRSGLLRDGAQRGAVGPARPRLRQVLVASELALAVMLLAAAGVLIRSFVNLQAVDTGFHAEGVLKAEFLLPPARYPADMQRWPEFTEQHAFVDRLLEEAGRMPGVLSAAAAAHHPLARGFTNSFRITGRETEGASQPEISIRPVSPGYFRTMGLTLASGRLLEERDGTRDPAVALLNVAAARRFFPGRNPEGERIALWGVTRTIVGVVQDERFMGVRGDPPIALYVPLAQVPGATVLLVRTAGEPLDAAPVVRQVFSELDPELAVFGVEPLTHTLSRTLAQPRVTTTVLAAFATAALLLGAVGVYGLISFDVARRRREFGVRMALGAAPWTLVAHVVRQGLAPAFAGLAAGLLGAIAVGRFLTSLLFGVSARDPLTLAVTALLLFAVAAVATGIPALRAARVDPAKALR